MTWLDALVQSYPGIFALFLTGTIGLLWASLRWFVKREFVAMEEHQGRQDRAIADVNHRLNAYDISFAVSKTSFDSLVEDLTAHIGREEGYVNTLTQIQVDIASIRGMLEGLK